MGVMDNFNAKVDGALRAQRESSAQSQLRAQADSRAQEIDRANRMREAERIFTIAQEVAQIAIAAGRPTNLELTHKPGALIRRQRDLVPAWQLLRYDPGQRNSFRAEASDPSRAGVALTRMGHLAVFQGEGKVVGISDLHETPQSLVEDFRLMLQGTENFESNLVSFAVELKK